jgi:hypothetical protein
MMHPDVTLRPVVRKLTVPKCLRFEILSHLREMNIHAASLFPGLDGLGRRLRLDLEIKVMQLSAERSEETERSLRLRLGKRR